MSRRRRWQNVKGTASRVTDPRERFLVAMASAGARLMAPLLGRPATSRPAEVLVLRLDRIGDVLMSLPALGALREALPDAKIRLVVGQEASVDLKLQVSAVKAEVRVIGDAPIVSTSTRDISGLVGEQQPPCGARPQLALDTDPGDGSPRDAQVFDALALRE